MRTLWFFLILELFGFFMPKLSASQTDNISMMETKIIDHVEFTNKSLDEIVSEINRYVPGKTRCLVILTNEEERSKKYTFQLSNAPVIEIVNYLAALSHLTVRFRDDQVFLANPSISITDYPETHKAQAQSEQHFNYVSTKETAIAIAVAVLSPIYGKETIEREKPYVVEETPEAWFVRGKLPAGNVGGVVEIIILKKDGKITKISHGS